MAKRKFNGRKPFDRKKPLRMNDGPIRKTASMEPTSRASAHLPRQGLRQADKPMREAVREPSEPVRRRGKVYRGGTDIPVESDLQSESHYDLSSGARKTSDTLMRRSEPTHRVTSPHRQTAGQRDTPIRNAGREPISSTRGRERLRHTTDVGGVEGHQVESPVDERHVIANNRPPGVAMPSKRAAARFSLGKVRFGDVTGRAAEVPETQKFPRLRNRAARRSFFSKRSSDLHPHSEDGDTSGDLSETPSPRKSKQRGIASQQQKQARLQFAADERPSDTDQTLITNGTPQPKKQAKLQQKADRAAAKLEKAQARLPSKRKLKVKREFDDAKGKPVRKLRFDEQPVSATEHAHIMPAPVRAAKKEADMGFREVAAGAHREVSKVEQENVGIEGAHWLERRAENTYRGGKKVTRGLFRFIRNKPYRVEARATTKSAKAGARLAYSNLLTENPQLRSTFFTRLAQKRKVQRKYAAAAYQAHETTVVQQNIRVFTARASKMAASFIRRHPMLAGSVALLVLFLGIGASFLTVFSDAGGSGVASIVGSTYLATDQDITNAELLYTKWETELLAIVQTAERDLPGYDEYRFRAGDVGHNPFELMAFLTCAYRDFKVSEIEGILRGIFETQYQFTTMEESETRYRAEQVESIDPVTGETIITEQLVAYEYRILNITLTTRSFTDVVSGRVGYEQAELYKVYMTYKGNRQYLASPFGETNWLPYVSSYYGYRLDPFTNEPGLHTGLDIGMPSGTDILAGHDGVVTEAGIHGDYGNLVVIQGKDGLVSKYGHCSTLLVGAGQQVKMNDVIAKVGSTGRSTGPHLHLEIFMNGFQLNPIYFAMTNDFSSGALGSGAGVVIPLDPGNIMGDDDFRKLIEEGNKHLGKAYMFGASGPRNFDCSGFVCWVYTKSGVHNLPRTTAQGIFNQCTPIAPDKAKPGDLIFFQGTYSTSNTVTHVGIYVGGNKMLHCGDPVQYAYMNTSYWNKHFYAFGRLN